MYIGVLAAPVPLQTAPAQGPLGPSRAFVGEDEGGSRSFGPGGRVHAFEPVFRAGLKVEHVTEILAAGRVPCREPPGETAVR